MDSEPDIGAVSMFVKNEPSQLIHSSSLPVIKKGVSEGTVTSCAESNVGISFMVSERTTRALDPIKEEQHSGAKKRAAMSLTRKSRSSDV